MFFCLRRPFPYVQLIKNMLPYVSGGINAGLRATVWINLTGHRRCAHLSEPTFEIKSVGEVPDIIERLQEADCATAIAEHEF